jgi:hypothetical protein
MPEPHGSPASALAHSPSSQTFVAHMDESVHAPPAPARHVPVVA